MQISIVPTNSQSLTTGISGFISQQRIGDLQQQITDLWNQAISTFPLCCGVTSLLAGIAGFAAHAQGASLETTMLVTGAVAACATIAFCATHCLRSRN